MVQHQRVVETYISVFPVETGDEQVLSRRDFLVVSTHQGELFALVGGYDEEVSSGEDLFITSLYRKHTDIGLDDALVLDHHLGRLSLRRLLSKKYSYGRTAQKYLTKARIAGTGTSFDIVRTSLSAYLRSWRFLLRHPALYLCIFPLRNLELFALQMGKWVAA